MKTGDVDFQILTCAICLHKERGAGIEPAIRGFADLRLPIWLSPRFQFHSIILCTSSASRFLLSFRSGLLVYFPLRAPHSALSHEPGWIRTSVLQFRKLALLFR